MFQAIPELSLSGNNHKVLLYPHYGNELVYPTPRVHETFAFFISEPYPVPQYRHIRITCGADRLRTDDVKKVELILDLSKYLDQDILQVDYHVKIKYV